MTLVFLITKVVELFLMIKSIIKAGSNIAGICKNLNFRIKKCFLGDVIDILGKIVPLFHVK